MIKDLNVHALTFAGGLGRAVVPVRPQYGFSSSVAMASARVFWMGHLGGSCSDPSNCRNLLLDHLMWVVRANFN